VREWTEGPRRPFLGVSKNLGTIDYCRESSVDVCRLVWHEAKNMEPGVKRIYWFQCPKLQTNKDFMRCKESCEDSTHRHQDDLVR
jgi:hypothetical protein